MASIIYLMDAYEETLTGRKVGETEETDRYHPSSYSKSIDTENDRSSNGSSFHYDEEDDFDDDDEDFENNEDDLNGEELFQSFLED